VLSKNSKCICTSSLEQKHVASQNATRVAAVPEVWSSLKVLGGCGHWDRELDSEVVVSAVSSNEESFLIEDSIKWNGLPDLSTAQSRGRVVLNINRWWDLSPCIEFARQVRQSEEDHVIVTAILCDCWAIDKGGVLIARN
jgi:hypothetical protein